MAKRGAPPSLPARPGRGPSPRSRSNTRGQVPEMAATPVMLPGARKHQLVLQEQYDAMRPLLSLTATCPELGDPLVARVATFLRDLGPSGNYPIKELWLDIVGGQSTYAKYASDPSQVNALYNSKQSIAEFAWFILALACLKGQPLVRGAVCFEDPEYRIFKAFARHGYSRVLGVAAALKTAEKNSFGSTHLLPFIQHSRGRGTWFTPEETHLFALSDATARGYTQVGIDIEYGKDAGVRLGLLAGCSHVLLGKIPLKGIGQTRQFTFFKIEQHGTKQAAQFVMHGFDLLHSIQAKKSKAKPKAGSGAEGETGPEFYHRRERVDKTLLASFVELVRAALNCQTTVPLWRSDLTVDEFAHRAKHVGLSLMFATANEIQIAATAMVRALRGAAGIAAKRSSENAAVLLAKTDAWLKSVARDPALDHVRYRFGREVILLNEEFKTDLTATQRRALHEREGLKRCVTSQFTGSAFATGGVERRSIAATTSAREGESSDASSGADEDFELVATVGGDESVEFFEGASRGGSGDSGGVSRGGSAVATHDFDAEFPGELSFCAGDSVVVEEAPSRKGKAKACGWAIATVGSERGVVPLNRMRFTGAGAF